MSEPNNNNNYNALDPESLRPKLQRTDRKKSLQDTSNAFAKFERLTEIINSHFARKATEEKQIEGLLDAILNSDIKAVNPSDLVSQLEMSEAKLHDIEADLYAKTKTLSKMKREWRKQLVKDFLVQQKQEKQKVMQEMLKKQGLNNTIMQDTMTKLPTQRSTTSSMNDSANELPRSKWDIPFKDLDIDYNHPLGKGQFGTVYKGKLFGKEVAVKKLLNQDWDEDSMSEFVKEVGIMVSLRHPNIILFIGAVTEPTNLCVVTEIMNRGSVSDLIHPKNGGQSPLNFKRKFLIAKQTAQGMNWLHSIEPAFLHLDLKPHNLLVDENWVVKVSDFGLSRMKNTDSTIDGLIGSPMYMCPEMMLGKKPTIKSDVYSFGIILWELLTEKVPYDNRFESLDELIEALTIDNERPPLPESCPPLLANLIRICWSADPETRPSFSDMLQSATFEEIIIEGVIAPIHTLGRQLWKENFFDRWQVSWKDFLGGFISSLELNVEAGQEVLNCLKIVVGADTVEEIVTIENFSTMLDWLGPLEKGSLFVYKLNEIFKKPYFFGQMSSVNAERTLNNKKKWTFLVRLSNSAPGAYGLSWVNREGAILHAHISHNAGHGFSLNGVQFATLDELVSSKKILKSMKPMIKLKYPCASSPFMTKDTSAKVNSLRGSRRKTVV